MLVNVLPIACALTPDRGETRLRSGEPSTTTTSSGVERTETQQIAHYVKGDDSMQRLQELVALESDCCSFVDWTIDTNHTDLWLVINGSAEQLAALDVEFGGQD